MIVSIHQPAYLPWLGYLDRIAKSGVFVYLDIVQFEKNSFCNRNRIKTARGPQWLTVPVRVRNHFEHQIKDLEIDNRQAWARKHLASIEQNYRRASRFQMCFEQLISTYANPPQLLADFCYDQLLFWMKALNIETPVIKASDLPVTSRKSDLVLDICRHLGAKTYLSGPLGRAYLDPASFADAAIHIEYHAFEHPIYPQLYGEFAPAMGVVDYWMNSGIPPGETGWTRNTRAGSW